MLLVPINIYDRQPLLALNLDQLQEPSSSVDAGDWIAQLAVNAAAVAAASQDRKVEYE